jgi:hypothetical protein
MVGRLFYPPAKVMKGGQKSVVQPYPLHIGEQTFARLLSSVGRQSILHCAEFPVFYILGQAPWMNVLKRLTMSDYQPAQRTVAGSIIPTIRYFVIALLLTLSSVLPVAATETPDVMLANIYRQHEDVTQFWVIQYPCPKDMELH